METIHVVLTGTIVPNASGSVVNDVGKRRQEYLDALRYYSSFAPVHFLENSTYDVAGDQEFASLQGVSIHKFPPSRLPERGKGFQEFEMLDAWLAVEANDDVPNKWLKITGRYIVKNVDKILQDYRERSAPGLVIDLCIRPRIARTHIFCAQTDFYRRYISSIYLQCDDSSGNWIERVLYKQIRSGAAGITRSFSVEPDVRAVSGSTGHSFESRPAIHGLKSILRRLNLSIDPQYLWYSR